MELGNKNDVQCCADLDTRRAIRGIDKVLRRSRLFLGFEYHSCDAVAIVQCKRQRSFNCLFGRDQISLSIYRPVRFEEAL
jgi:hypothetical protein